MDQGPQKTRRRKRKAWSYVAGRKGRNRVRVFERPGYGLVIDYRDEQGKRIRESLKHSDRARAEAQADEIAAKLRRGEQVKRPSYTLFDITKRYLAEETPRKGAGSQKHDRRAIPLLLRCFGVGRLPETLTVRDWNAYIVRRSSGDLRAPKAKRRDVRARVVEQDLNLCRAIFNWACKAQMMAFDPFRGLKVQGETSPQRAQLTSGQYEAVRLAAASISPRLECFVVLAWHTGHRGKSIRHLRWGDVDLERETVLWRAEADKIGYEHRNPLHPAAVAILKRERAREGILNPDAWIFPSGRDARKQLSGDAVANLWKRLASLAAIPSGRRYGWHSMRRSFANRHRRAPLRDLKDLGGWKSTRTVIDVYLGPDEEAQREVLVSEGQQSQQEAQVPATGGTAHG